jgi:toxin secretion/phage lysis holin
MITVDLSPTSIVKAKLALVPGAILSLLAGVHPLLIGLFIFQVIDFFTGIMASLGAGHKLSSALATAGMKKKFMMWMYVLMAHLLVTISPKPLNFEAAGAVAGLWICVEAISICENGSKMGLPPPKPIQWAIVKFQAIYEQSSGQMTGTMEIASKPTSGITPPPDLK